jgi:hypothetical protein
MARPVHSDVPPMPVQCPLPKSANAFWFCFAMLCNARRKGEWGMGLVMQSIAMSASSWMPGNSIAHIITSHLISPLRTSGSPLSAHHPLVFSFSSPVLFVPVPILSHLTSITPMGPARQEVHPDWWRPCSIGGYRWASTALMDGIGVVGGLM